MRMEPEFVDRLLAIFLTSEIVEFKLFAPVNFAFCLPRENREKKTARAKVKGFLTVIW